MKKCKKKDGLIYDFEVVEIKKDEYRIYLNDDFVCAMSENDFKENFEILEEDTTEGKEEEASYIVKPVDWYKTIGIDYTDEKFKEKVYSMIPSDESEIEVLKSTLEGMEKNDEKMQK